jgi:hypothetical protein
MLLLGSTFDVAGLTVLRDHISPTTFHYLPGRPRLVSSDGRPGAQLLRYRGEGASPGGEATPAGGGLLTLDVHLGHDARAVDEARDVLAARVGDTVSLVPVTFSEGQVRLALLGAESRPASDGTAGGGDGGAAVASSVLVEQVLASATPALFGDARAIFSVALSAEGATLIEHALRSGSLPVVLVYDLAFDGLRLARGIRASVDYRMAYDFLRARAAVNSLFFKADVDGEAEALRREQLISIEDVDYTGTDPDVLAPRAEEIKKTLQELVQALFYRPAASPASLPPQVLAAQPAIERGWGAAGRVQAAFVLRDLKQQETGRLDYDFTMTRVARQTIAPQGSLTALDGFSPDRAIRDVDLTERGPRQVRAIVPPAADWTGVGAVEITLQPSDGSAPVSDAVRPDKTETTLEVPAGDVTYATRVLVRPDPEALGSPAEIASPSVPLPADTLVLDPASLAERHPLTLTLSAIDTASRIRARGSVERGTASRPFVLDLARPSIVVPIWGRDSVRLSVAVEIDGIVAQTDVREVGASERLVAISAPRDRVQLVVMELLDPLGRFESVFVEIEGVPDGGRRQVRLDAAAPRQEWTVISPAGAGARGYRYRVRKVSKSARSVELPWTPGAGQLLLVGDTDIRVVPVEVILLGAPANAVAVELTVTSLAPPPDVPAATSTIVEQATRATIAVPFAGTGPIRYRVEGRVFTETGDERPIGPVEDTGEVCLVTVG